MGCFLISFCLGNTQGVACDDRHDYRRGYEKDHMLTRIDQVLSLRHFIIKIILNFTI